MNARGDKQLQLAENKTNSNQKVKNQQVTSKSSGIKPKTSEIQPQLAITFYDQFATKVTEFHLHENGMTRDEILKVYPITINLFSKLSDEHRPLYLTLTSLIHYLV